MFGHDVMHTGRSSYAGSSTNLLKWKFATESSAPSSPSIGSDGTIYVGGGDGKLYAINPDGTKRWSFAKGGSVDSSPAIGSDGAIYVGSDDNSLYAINPDGTKGWNYSTRGDVRSSPAIGPDGTVYIGSGDGYLYAIGTPSSTTTSTTEGRGGIPEFPYQLGIAAAFTVLVLASYLLVKHRSGPSLRPSFVH